MPGGHVPNKLRTFVTLVVLIGILSAGAYYGWRGLGGGAVLGLGGDTADDRPEVCTTPEETVRTRGTRVSVYNAGAASGTATRVMDALTRRGFREGVLADAPEGIEVRGVVLWVADREAARTKLVRRQFRFARVVERRNRLGPGINVLVGGFRSLAENSPRRITVELPEQCEAA
ncbi:MAG: hypothetical protein GEU93_14470 [Propionibacteriales bacterium]|nr:hypothetical protein [Propionibacteriales bacterium]